MPMPDMMVRTSAKSRLMSPGTEDEVRDALHRLQQHGVGDLERLHQRRAAVHDGEEALVGDGDERVHHRAQLGQARLGLLLPPAPSKWKGLVTTATVRMPRSLRHCRHHGRRAGAGAAAEPGGDEHHVGALEHLRGSRSRSSWAALFPTSGLEPAPEPAGELARRAGSCTGAGEERSAWRSVLATMNSTPVKRCRHHPVDGIGAAAAEADHLDLGDFTLLVELEHRPRRPRPCSILASLASWPRG